MTRRSCTYMSPALGRLAAPFAAALVAACIGSEGLAAQAAGSAPEALREQVERRFDVLTVQDGLALRPKSPVRDVRWVEVTDGTITVNGAPVSGGELRERLGGDAGVVMQLSYLDAAARAALFRGADSRPPVETISPDQTPPTRHRAGSGQFRLGGNITVPADEIVSDDVVAVGGSIHVLGEVRGDVVAIGGTVELGPASLVRNVTVVGGSLRRDPSARISGEVVEIGAGSMDFAGVRFPRRILGGLWRDGRLGSAFALFSTMTRVAVLCLVAALAVLLGREHIVRISARAAAEPFKAGAIGLLAQLLFLPLLIVTIVLLVVTIIGIPLLLLIPFVLLGLGVIALVGFASVAHYVGLLLTARFGWPSRGPYGTTIAGILLLVSPVLLARIAGLGGGVLFPVTIGLVLIGTIVEYLAWTIGFGAVALVRFTRPEAVTPAP